MQKKYYKLFFYFTISIVLFSYYCAFKIGLNPDEAFHHANGAARYMYMKSLGGFDEWDIMNTRYYPGLYDTIVYSLHVLLDNFINVKYTVEIKHTINWLVSSLGVLGLFLLNRKIFNKEIAILSCALTLLNPIFFGHMGMNPKDPIIFTSLIWSIYFFVNYLENMERSRFKYLILMSLAIGFGVGIRITFISLIVPLFFIWIYIIFKKKINITSIILDIFCGSFIIFFLAFLTWPDIHNGNFIILLEIIERSSNWLIAFRHGIINGKFYEIAFTPRTYILQIFLARIPLYFSLLTIFSYLVIFTKKDFFKENFNSKFLIFFSFTNLILFFPITTMVITKTNLYDNGRLILFTMPFFATIASIGLFYIIMKFKEFSYLYKSFSLIIFLLMLLSFYRFFALTPYQYVYTNYLSTPKFSMGENKFEHDYIYTSYPELMKNIKKKYGEVEASKLKIRTCDNHFWAHKNYFRTILKTKQTAGVDADYVIMTNRNLKYRKMNCFQLFEGEDLVSVKRLGLTLSTFRKIQSEEAQVYNTTEWDVKNRKWYKEMRERNKHRKSRQQEIREKYDSNRGATKEGLN